jgi:hypothetical protein
MPAQSAVQFHCHAPTAIDSTSPEQPSKTGSLTPCDKAYCIATCKRALAQQQREVQSACGLHTNPADAHELLQYAKEGLCIPVKVGDGVLKVGDRVLGPVHARLQTCA